MKKLLINSFLAALFTSISFGVHAQGKTQASYFTKSLVSSILNQQGCVGLRLYPVTDVNKNQVVMIIGIDANGNELYNEANSNYKYQIFVRVSGTKVTDVALDKRLAQSACRAYTANNTPFVSDFTKAAIEDLISGESSGIVAEYIPGGAGNFSLKAYKTDSGVKPYGKTVLGEPCPTACGEPQQYLCYPK